ncbi:MAG: 4Fe-4S dicluster domain-containing protein [Candidatus Omnitrophota bacterium]
MAKRKIIEIDREKCNGCGLCTKACAEGALVLDEHKKAVLVKEIFCDGMGACLDVCPVDALKIIERDSSEYDAKAAFQHVMNTQGPEAAKKVHGASDVMPHFGGCPGSMAREIKPHAPSKESKEGLSGSVQSELSQWPIQLHLISPIAPYFKECDLLIAADCTAFTLGSFHQDMLKGKKLVIACPKLDETGGYIEKIAELLKNNTVYSLTVVIMEVPCCSGLFRIVQDAVELSGTHLPIKRVVIGLDGAIRS